MGPWCELVYAKVMDRVEAVEAAISNFPPEEFRRLVDWLREP